MIGGGPSGEKEQNAETVFQSWITELQGRFWLNSSAMPEGVYDVLQSYKHFSVHEHSKEDIEKMEKATEDFRRLTGFEIQDFLRYQEEQNQKLKTDKK